MEGMSLDTENAMKTFELENQIEEGGPDNIYCYDAVEQQRQLQEKPWAKDPHHFKHVKISSLALLRMVMHARSGGQIEVMGLMQGKVYGDTMVVMDAFALPVEGTETRVNSQQEGYEYMVEYVQLTRKAGRLENVLGWYHSHPGYGCWLSGIDVSTQMLNQQFQEPFVAVVIDPTRTISGGKVELGAFRTFPKDYSPPKETTGEYQSIPISKIDDFGVYAKQYYSLEVGYFKSSLDQTLFAQLWNQYWVSTLSSSALLTNKEYFTGQIVDVAEKLDRADTQLRQVDRMGHGGAEGKEKTSQLQKVAKDSSRLAIEGLHGMLSQVLKIAIFNQNPPILPQSFANEESNSMPMLNDHEANGMPPGSATLTKKY